MIIVPEFARLSELVHVILGLNPGKMTLSGTNCYLVGSGHSRILIDTGQGMETFLPHLKDCLQKAGAKSLSAILITHRYSLNSNEIDTLITPSASLRSLKHLALL